MESQINIRVALDEEKMPDTITWQAAEGGVPEYQDAKALLLGLWDGTDKAALRIDLWTSKMMVDEMNEFFFQSLMGMAETYQRATNNNPLAEEMKKFANKFRQQAQDALMDDAAL